MQGRKIHLSSSIKLMLRISPYLTVLTHVSLMHIPAHIQLLGEMSCF
ncbi:unnamed protein product, partial [Prunus brigantina]